MSLSGFTTIDVTVAQPLDQPVVYEWLRDHGIRWRVYRSGLPFDMLMPRLWDDVFSERFRSVKYLAADVMEEPDATFPQVMFIEPSFGDSPVHLGYPPNDDHPPIAAGPGQQFLRDVYLALTSNPDRWKKTVLVVTYDEHGGFFDHLVPPAIPNNPPTPGLYRPFATTGVRVPGLVVSPLVKAGSVYKGLLDHTSMLQFIASRFGEPEETYSSEVESRRVAGIGNVGDTLNRDEPRAEAPRPPDEPVSVEVELVSTKPSKDKNENEKAFENAARRMLAEKREDVRKTYPELLQWEAAQR
jgi:phospholipase C